MIHLPLDFTTSDRFLSFANRESWRYSSILACYTQRKGNHGNNQGKGKRKISLRGKKCRPLGLVLVLPASWNISYRISSDPNKAWNTILYRMMFPDFQQASHWSVTSQTQWTKARLKGKPSANGLACSQLKTNELGPILHLRTESVQMDECFNRKDRKSDSHQQRIG